MIGKRFFIKLIIFWLFCGVARHGLGNALEAGKPAPSLQLKTIDGQPLAVVQPLGYVWLVHFWATWCKPCRKEMPVLDAYYEQHKAQGLRMVAISLDDPADDNVVREFVKGFHFPVVFGRDVDYRKYGRIRGVPATFVIDREGVLRKDGSVGSANMDQTALDATVTPLLEK